MKYTQETHYATIILQTITYPKYGGNKWLRTNFSINGNNDLTPVEITFKDIPCWIQKGELDLLSKHNINVNDIEVITYVQGLLSPFGVKSSLAGSCIDGYQVHLLHNLASDNLVTIEFKSVWDWHNQKYHRLGDPETIIEVSKYRKVTNRNLDNLNIFEKTDLIERANLLTTLVNEDLKDLRF